MFGTQELISQELENIHVIKWKKKGVKKHKVLFGAFCDDAESILLEKLENW